MQASFIKRRCTPPVVHPSMFTSQWDPFKHLCTHNSRTDHWWAWTSKWRDVYLDPRCWAEFRAIIPGRKGPIDLYRPLTSASSQNPQPHLCMTKIEVQILARIMEWNPRQGHRSTVTRFECSWISMSNAIAKASASGAPIPKSMYKGTFLQNPSRWPFQAVHLVNPSWGPTRPVEIYAVENHS